MGKKDGVKHESARMKRGMQSSPPPSLQTIRSSQCWSGQWETAWCYFHCYLVREYDFNAPSISAKVLGPEGLLMGLSITLLMIRGCGAGNPHCRASIRSLPHSHVWPLHQVNFYTPRSLAHGVSINSQLCSQAFPTSHLLSNSRAPGLISENRSLSVVSGQGEKTLRGIKWERREMKLP